MFIFYPEKKYKVSKLILNKKIYFENSPGNNFDIRKNKLSSAYTLENFYFGSDK